MSDGKIVFEITGDNSSLKRTLSDTTRDIKTESGKWEKDVDDSSGNISDNLIGAFKKVATSAAFVKIGQMLLQLGIESVNLASDLEEVQNVVDVTFGDEGSAKIEKWAKAAGKQYGLTELQAKRYASTMGAMMKSSGVATDDIYDLSTGLAGLAADIASFYNLDFDDAFLKLQSGISGEIEPLRRLGINMSIANLEAFALANGIEKEYKDMSQAEQTLLRYNYLMQATADAQGDFARTSDSYANSQRRIQTGFDTLKAQLGEAILPIASTVSDAIADLLEILTYSPPETVFSKAEDSITGASSAATQAQGILGYMDSLYAKYGDAAKKTDEWRTALEKLKEVFPDVNQFINDETGELIATNEELRKYIENSKQAAIEDAKKAALSSLNQQYVEAGQAYYTAEINRDIAKQEAEAARQSMIDYIASKPGQEGFTGAGMSMEQIEYAAKAVANEFGESQSAIQEWSRIYKEQTQSVSAYQSEMDTLKGKMESLEAELNIATQALDRMAAAAQASANRLAGSAGMSSGQYYNWYYGGADGSHAGGLNYVPFDGYRAILHRGERIQTAAEASLSRQHNLQAPGTDYNGLSAAIWDGAPKMGGNVYLDGRVVGQVISDQQGRSFRQLQRSGWQG